MSKVTVPSPDGDEVIDLKDPVVAAILGWLIPGLGHLYQGRTAKGLLFLICILTIFIYGLYLSGGHAVYAAWSDWDQRLHYLSQIWTGLVALPALLQNYLVRGGHAPLFGGLMAPPTTPQELHEWHRSLHTYLELGTVYTDIAGLLNVLAIFDAFAGPVALEADEKSRADEQPAPSGA